MPLVLLAFLLFLPQGVDEIAKGPAPSASTVSWELDFRFLDPRRIEVQLPGQSEPETFWYMVYTVSNPNPQTHFFFPTFEIVTDDLRVFETDLGIPPQVFEAIRERHRRTHPYLVNPTRAIGELLRGEDHARESVAVWRVSDINATQFRVYVGGLSGEVRLVPNPAHDPNDPEVREVAPDGREVVQNPKFFTLRKTLEIRYNLPGSPAARGVATPERMSVRWVMR